MRRRKAFKGTGRPPRRRHRPPPAKLDLPGYRQVWRVVDGAIADAIRAHPQHYAQPGEARASIVKRVTGGILGYLAQAGWGRSGKPPAAAKARVSYESDDRAAGALVGTAPARGRG
jgi:hypothetical protein